MENPNTDVLLELSSTPQRRHIKIDGTPYPIRSQEEFSLAELTRLRRVGLQLKSWAENPEVDDGEILNTSDALDSLFRSIVIDGEAVSWKLADQQKLDVLNVFFAQAGPKATRPAETSTTS